MGTTPASSTTKKQQMLKMMMMRMIRTGSTTLKINQRAVQGWVSQ
jgi:hypothetical protein